VITLRPDQAKVAEYRGGYMAVPAVPGAGKTTVLGYLVADLIAAGAAAPGRILVVTYTNSGAGNLRSRIGEFLEERGYPRSQGYEVRTIHSLAMNVVRERPDALLWSDGFTIADEERQRSLLQGLTRAWLQRHRERWEPIMREDLKGHRRNQAEERWGDQATNLFRSLIQAWKARRVGPRQALELTRALPAASFLRWAAEVYGEYQRALDAQGLVDFGDLVLGACRLVDEDPELLERLRRRWTYVFEDEAQDSYRLQTELLQRLAGPSGNLVRVGDANQAIMGTFTSAEPDLFRHFCREPGVTVRPLTMAARSSQDVIDLANELVRWSREEHPEPECREALEAQRIEPVPAECGGGNPVPERYTVACRVREGFNQELALLTQAAARYVQRQPEGTAAVLLPTGAMLDGALQLLTDQGVNARRLDHDPRRRRSIEDLLTILEFLAAPHLGDRLRLALCRMLGLAPESAPFAAFVAECLPETLFFPLDGSAPFADLYAAVPESRGWIELEQALQRLRRWLPLSVLPADELLLQVAAELELTAEELAVAHHMALRARLFLLDSPAFGLPEVTAELRAIRDGALGKFADTLYDRKGFKAEPGMVYVATCHSAKGLEWETVCAGALTREEFPSLQSDRIRSEQWYLRPEVINPEALAMAELRRCTGEIGDPDPVHAAKREMISERLRLLYVVVTRAKSNLLLSAHRENRFGRETGPALPFAVLQRFSDERAGRAESDG